jgi:translation initiation factor IF-1
VAGANPSFGGKPSQLDGRVVESLPGALYSVELEGVARTRLTAHVSGESSLLRILPGETVVVEISRYDAKRGRIVGRR